MARYRNSFIKRLLALAITLLAAYGFSANAQMVDELSDLVRPTYVAGEVLVKFKPTVGMQAQNQMISTLGAKRLATIGRAGIAQLKLPQGTRVIDAVEALKLDISVAHAQPNYLYYTAAVPNDTNYGQLWGLKNTGQTITNPAYGTNNPGTSGLDMDAELAWDQLTDCRSTIVAVLDTGINYSHTDLLANMWDGSGSGFPNHGWDFIDNFPTGDNNPMPTGAFEDHGTHVAGTIAAVGNNSIGTTGVCWQARIMSVRVLGATGSGTTAGIILGIEWASDNGARVINMSLGGGGGFDTLYSNAITYARDRDVVVVVAAGNGASNNDSGFAAVWPCNFTQNNLVCVAALDQAYALADFSNWGSTSVDVGAPGTNVLSSWAGTLFKEDFSTGAGWLLNGGWTRLDTASSCVTSGGTPIETLVNPANWCAGGPYSNNITDNAYKTFDLSGASVAAVGYFAMWDTEAGADFFRTNYKSTGGDPFTGGINVNELSGSSSGFVSYEHDLSACLTATCSIGFQLATNASGTDRGVSLALFKIGTLESSTNADNVINGTSMASPHVAGLATMLRAYNPNYTYTDVVNAIKNGGENVAALSTITTTGKAANAMGSLAYINPPGGVGATLP